MNTDVSLELAVIAERDVAEFASEPFRPQLLHLLCGRVLQVNSLNSLAHRGREHPQRKLMHPREVAAERLACFRRHKPVMVLFHRQRQGYRSGTTGKMRLLEGHLRQVVAP